MCHVLLFPVSSSSLSRFSFSPSLFSHTQAVVALVHATTEAPVRSPTCHFDHFELSTLTPPEVATTPSSISVVRQTLFPVDTPTVTPQASKMAHLALCIFALLTLLTTRAVADITVHSSFLFLRTGDRTPLTLTSTTPTLSPLGAQQLYSVGEFFRARYITNALSLGNSSSALNTATIANLSVHQVVNAQLYLLALDQPYSVASATAFLQGIYPPFSIMTDGNGGNLGEGDGVLSGGALAELGLLGNQSYVSDLGSFSLFLPFASHVSTFDSLNHVSGKITLHVLSSIVFPFWRLSVVVSFVRLALMDCSFHRAEPPTHTHLADRVPSVRLPVSLPPRSICSRLYVHLHIRQPQLPSP